MYEQLFKQRLPVSFYQQADVVLLAKALLGKILVTHFEQQFTAGRIVETEAYNGIVDKASHAYNNRRTPRTETMFAAGGVAYVYLCYGMHQMFNVVTNEVNIPHAILIRAVEPLAGIDIMLQRCRKTTANTTLTKGPGNVAKAFGLHTLHTGMSLLSPNLFIADNGENVAIAHMKATPRIGIDYAGEDALLPYRFIVHNSPYISGNKKQNFAV